VSEADLTHGEELEPEFRVKFYFGDRGILASESFSLIVEGDT
jgi:hypothetical protein